MSKLPKGFHDWTSEQKSAYWAEQRKQERNDRQACIDYLQEDQRIAVRNAYSAMENVVESLNEYTDVWLSDLKRLDDSMWKLRHQFNLDPNND